MCGNSRCHSSPKGTHSFYTPEEIRVILRLKDKDTVYLLCRSKEIAGAIKIGRYWRIDCTLFDKWLDSKVTQSCQ
jgi:hypothetical protein